MPLNRAETLSIVGVMRLADADVWQRLSGSDHGVLCTIHPTRGVDAVPVVYALVGSYVGVPVDRVKPKSSTKLQRERNLRADPRATLLVEHWDRDDWTRLWWVRAHLRYEPGDVEVELGLANRLAERYAQYAARPFERVLPLRIVELTGWAAAG